MRVAIFLLVLAVASLVQAALPPEEYQRLRQVAPVVIGGVVLQDPGGQAQLRVEHVARGPLQPGEIVTVVYPLEPPGPVPVGGAVFYRPFPPGMRIMVYGQGAPVVYAMDGGIDIVSIPPPAPRQRSGCASCALGASRPVLSVWPALLALLAWRARRSMRSS